MRFIILALVSSLLLVAGCKKAPPKCEDSVTVDLVYNLLHKQSPDDEFTKHQFKLENIVCRGSVDNGTANMCQAELKHRVIIDCSNHPRPDMRGVKSDSVNTKSFEYKTTFTTDGQIYVSIPVI